MKEIKWIYQGDSEEEEFLQNLDNIADLIFEKIEDLPANLPGDWMIFDLHSCGIYAFSKASFAELKAIWKESLLIREYKKEENQYLIG